MADALRRAGLVNDSGAPASGKPASGKPASGKPASGKPRRRDDRP